MKTRTAVAAASALIALAACQPIDTGGGNTNDGPPSQWKGTNLQVCGVPNTPPPGRVFGHVPGKTHVLVVITADITRIKNGREVCVPNASIPFEINLSGWLDGKPALKPDRGQTLPWIAHLVTPHFEHFLIPQSAIGRAWKVQVHALHEEGTGVVASSIPLSFIRCAIFVEGHRVNDASARIRKGMVVASCGAEDIVR